MNGEDPENDSFEGWLRRIAQRVDGSVKELRELDVDDLARLAAAEVERAGELLQEAGRWISTRTDGFVDETVWRLERFSIVGRGDEATSAEEMPHPRDLPTAEQGRALSAIDSGRWAVEPGTHTVVVRGGGPTPIDAAGLVGELRVRDWITATGELTMVGRSALQRWTELSDAT
jgi:hypothetical protein